MRILFLSIPIILLAVTTLAQDICGPDAIMAIRGGWKQAADVHLRYDKNQTRIDRYLDSVRKILLSGIGELKGEDGTWYRIGAAPLIPAGPSAYCINSLYKAWYCNVHAHKLMLGSETGTWVEININTLNSFLSDQYDKTGYEINGAPIYALPSKKGTWKGYELYQPRGRTAASCVLITRGGMKPWRAITQREYLQAWKASIQKQQAATTINMAAMQEEDKKEIEKIQNNPNLKPETREAMLNGIRRRQAMYGAGSNGRDKISKSMEDQAKRADDYLARTPQEVLNQPAWIGARDHSGFDGSFSSESGGGVQMVTIDPTFFSKQVSGYAPQLIVFHWRWDNDVASLNFKAQLEQNFPIDKLAAMVYNAK